MPAVFLPSYSASFAPVDGLSGSGNFSAYWDEIQDRTMEVFRSLGAASLPKKLPAEEGAGIASCANLSGGGSVYAAGIYFRNSKAQKNPVLWAAQYDIAVCSFDEGLVEEFRRKMGSPMRSVRRMGPSEILFPVFTGYGVWVAQDRRINEELERELMATA
ncbi:MAG: hypothetical protein HY516_03895 [Candidatus Aenigmarchaeota archaeon]|nr:hypothetical protein [Candidatus Aenigmarchaeota archaeon]